eukprot:2442243-Pleurochrysis_carterae.AAC.1
MSINIDTATYKSRQSDEERGGVGKEGMERRQGKQGREGRNEGERAKLKGQKGVQRAEGWAEG